MAEQVILVCDVCGSPAKQTVTFSVGARHLAQDLCGVHFQELTHLVAEPEPASRKG